MVRQKKTDSLFSANLKELLEKRNITQKQASILCGVNPSVVNSWLNGTQPYDMIAVAKLAKALNADFQKLLTSIPSSVETLSLNDIFHIEEDSSFSGIYKIEVKRLVQKKSHKIEDDKNA